MSKQMRRTGFTVGGLIMAVLIAAPLEAAPPRGQIPTTVPDDDRRPPTPTPSPDREFDWEGVVDGILRGIERGQRRPYPRPYPDYREPERVIPIPGNVVQPPSVAPLPNKVIVQIPKQSSPLAGRVWEVSVREARCYSKELRGRIDDLLNGTSAELTKVGVDTTAIEPQLQQLLQLLEKDVPWRDIEPIARRLVEENRNTFSADIMARFEDIVRLILVRDAFLMVGNAGPRGRSVALTIPAIPVGLIWVVFDPTLAAGTALLVSDRIIVCGGGPNGELTVVESTAAEALGLPVAPGDPVPDVSDEEARSIQDGIVVSNGGSGGTAVNYVLNGQHPYTIQPGHKQILPLDRDWTIEFDRGVGGRAARYSLTKGFYEFRIVDKRWELVKLKFNVTIDNRAGVEDFQYVVNNEVVSVKPGETKTHTSQEPVLIEFDRGEGTENTARKNLNKSGTYKVAVDTQTNCLDLFPSGEES